MYTYLKSKQEEADALALSVVSAPMCLCHLVLTPMWSQYIFISIPAEEVEVLP